MRPCVIFLDYVFQRCAFYFDRERIDRIDRSRSFELLAEFCFCRNDAGSQLVVTNRIRHDYRYGERAYHERDERYEVSDGTDSGEGGGESDSQHG